MFAFDQRHWGVHVLAGTRHFRSCPQLEIRATFRGLSRKSHFYFLSRPRFAMNILNASIDGHPPCGTRIEARCYAWRALRRIWFACLVVSACAATGCASLPTLSKPAFLTKGSNEDPLVTATSGKIPSERAAAIKKLATQATGERRDQIAVQLTDVLTREPSPPLRAELCRTLSHFNHPAADRAVRAALKDQEIDVRIAAAQSLSRHGGRQAPANARNPEREQTTRGILAETLAEDAAPDVRMAAIRSLAQFDGDEVKTALGAVLEDPNPALQRRAMHALAESTGKDFGNDVRAWREYVQGGNPTPRTESVADRMMNYLRTY